MFPYWKCPALQPIVCPSLSSTIRTLQIQTDFDFDAEARLHCLELGQSVSIVICVQSKPTCDVYSGPGDAFSPVAAM